MGFLPGYQRTRSAFKNNHFTEMCCGTEAGSYLRLIDSCITQLKAQGPSQFRTCNESKEEEEEACVDDLGGEFAEDGVLVGVPAHS